MKITSKNTKTLFCILLTLLFFVPNSFSAVWLSLDSPVTETLKDLWGSSSNNVFAVGSNGTILYYNGFVWTTMTTPITNDLQGIWGASASDLIAVGDDGIMLRYNGSTWTKQSSGSSDHLNDVWVSSESEIFIVGEYGEILLCNEDSCNKGPNLTHLSLNSVWGTSDDNVFAVGGGGVILHYDGLDWYEMESGTDENLNSVYGTSENNIFAVGANGTILRYNGTSWKKMSIGTKNEFYALAGNTPNYIFAIGKDGMLFRLEGSVWSPIESGTTKLLQGIWVSPSQDVFVVGYKGTILYNENTPPTASFSINRTSGVIVETIFQVDASDCYDAEDNTDDLMIRWDWENDSTWDTDYSNIKTANHQYLDTGNYTVVLEVIDTGKLIDVESIQVVVLPDTPPTARFSVEPTSGSIRTTFSVDASESFDALGNTDTLQFRWDWENDDVWDTEYTTTKTAEHIYQIPGTYLIRLEVKDLNGLTDSTTEEVTVGLCVASNLLGQDDPRLEVLRQFRDQFMSHSQIGRSIIKFYYSQEDYINYLFESSPVITASAKKILEKTIPVLEKYID